MDDQDQRGEENSAQQDLNTTITLSTPDVVSSCEGSALDSFGILNLGEMTDFSTIVPDSVEKQITNRNIDETFDADCTVAVPSTAACSVNSTMLSSKDDVNPRSSASQPLPTSSSMQEEDAVPKNTPSHFLPDSMPCHSTPLNELANCLEMVAPLVDEIEHHDGDEWDQDFDDLSNVDDIASKNINRLAEAQLYLQSTAETEAPSSNSKVNPLKLPESNNMTITKSKLKPKLSNPTRTPLFQSKPKPPFADLGIKQVGTKIVKSLSNPNPKPAGRSLLLSRSSVAGAGNIPRNKSPLLKIALTRPLTSKPDVKQTSAVPKSSLAPSGEKPNNLSTNKPPTLTKSTLKVQRSESNLSTSSVKSNISSKSTISASNASARNSQAIPKTGNVASKKVDTIMDERRKSGTRNLKKSSSSLLKGGLIGLDQSDSNASMNPPVSSGIRKSMSIGRPSAGGVPKAIVSRASLSNNNGPKSNVPKPSLAPGPTLASDDNVSKTGARPKIPSRVTQKTTNAGLGSKKLSKQVKPSSLEVDTRNSTTGGSQSRLAVSNSFVSTEVADRPRLPPRSLSNLTPVVANKSKAQNKNNSASKLNPGNRSRITTSRIQRNSTTNLMTPRSSQPDLLKTVTPRSELEREIVKVKASLAEKTTELELATNVIRDNNVGFDSLAIVAKNYIDKFELVHTLQEDLGKWRCKYEASQAEMESSQHKHKLAEDHFNNLMLQLGRDIETMCRKHEEDKDSMKEAYRCQIEAQRLDLQEEMRKRKKKNEKEVAVLEEKHRVDISKLESSMKLSLANEKAKLESRERELRKNHDLEKDNLEQKVQQLETKVSALIVSLMNGPDHRDGAIAEMQKEIDSLAAVVEMKSDEVKSVREENRKLCQKMMMYKEMKIKVGNLSSQVEDMKELLTIKRCNERKLDAELHELQESMHKTSREKRRLSIEKEQLEWRMKQGMPYQRCLVEDTQSHSFSGETQHSRRNFKTFHFRSPSLNNTEPIPLPPFTNPLDLSPPANRSTPSSSTPSMVDLRTSRASVSYQLDISDSRNMSPGSAVRVRRQKKLDAGTGLGDRV